MLSPVCIMKIERPISYGLPKLKIENSKPCPCNSGMQHINCCHPFIALNCYPSNPVELLRARFCAIHIGGYGEFLLKSIHRAVSTDYSIQQLSQRLLQYQDFKIVEVEEVPHATLIKLSVEIMANGLKETRPYVHLHHNERVLITTDNGEYKYLTSEFAMYNVT